MRKSQLLEAIKEAQRNKLSVTHDQALEAQEEVEAAKFELGQEDLASSPLAAVDEGLPDLPNGYGESRIVLMPRDPQWAYAYWDIANSEKEKMRQQGGQQVALRIYDVTDLNLGIQAPHSIQEYPCDELAREWYLPIPVSDRDYVAEIGYRCPDGRWLLLAQSQPVRIPPVYPSDWIDDQFVTIAWNEELVGKAFFKLVGSGQQVRVGAPIHAKMYDLAEEEEAKRAAGSLYGSKQPVSGSAQMVTGSGQMIPGSAQMVTGSGQMIPGSAQMVTGSGQMIPGSAQMVTGSGQMIPGSAQMVMGSGQMIPGSAQMVMGSGQMIPGSAQMVMGSGQMIPGSAQMVMGSGQMIPGSIHMMVPGSAQMVMGSGQMIPGSIHMIPGSAQMGVSSYVFPSGVGMWAIPTMSGLTMSGVGFSASAPPVRPRQFWLIADAELIVYGATEPDATVTIGGRPIKLNSDGTFRFQMSFQDGLIDYPIMAVASDGEQTRSIHMQFKRETPSRNTNAKEEAVLEWLA
jgi:hypothetical protein